MKINKVICDHCGKEIKNLSPKIRLQFLITDKPYIGNLADFCNLSCAYLYLGNLLDNKNHENV